jgi:membrane-associated phospholipid phosphatase
VNGALLDLLNGNLAGRWDLLDDQYVFWAQYGIFLLAACAGAFGLREFRYSRRRALAIAATAIGGAMLAGIALIVAGDTITEARPFVTDHDTIQLLKHGADNSFPSDHATLAALIAAVAAFAWPRWAALFIALGLLIGLSRVISGVHYPGDVLAGWFIGALSACAAWFAIRRFTPVPLEDSANLPSA